MMNTTLAPETSRITAGPWLHRGSLVLTMQLDNGQVITVSLPEDWQTLLSRVTALEARTLEDMHYGH